MGKKILFWGDSITDGNRLKGKENEWDLNHQIGHCYAYLISARMGLEYPEKDYHFLDRGISGFRISDLYARLHEDVLPEKPDCVSILIGINDCLQRVRSGYGGDPQWFAQTYRAILQELRAQNPNVLLVLCEPFCLPVGAVAEKFDEYTAAMAPLQEVARTVAQEYQAVFVPLQSAFSNACKNREASYWSWDGIHPTVSGHALLAREWEKAVGDRLL